MKIAFIIQRYGTEILGGSEYHCRLIAERLAAAARGRGADDLRPRLHHLEERVPRGHRPHPRRHGPALRQRADARHRRRSTATRTGSSTTRTPATTRWSGCKQQGPWCPALLEYLERHHASYDALIFFTYLYAPTVLGLQVAPGAEHPRADGARRAGHPPRRSTRRSSRCRPAIAYNTEVERRFLTTRVPDPRRRPRRRSAAASTCRSSSRAHRARSRTSRRRRRRTTRRAGSRDAAPDAAVAPHGARRGVPAPAPAARPVRALRRPHRPGQGLRGADRVLQQLRAARAATRRSR